MPFSSSIASNRVWEYQHWLDHGPLIISVPDKLSKEDVKDIEAHFKLIIRQCERRAK